MIDQNFWAVIELNKIKSRKIFVRWLSILSFTILFTMSFPSLTTWVSSMITQVNLISVYSLYADFQSQKFDQLILNSTIL